MVGPAFHANFNAGQTHRANPLSLVLAQRQSDREFNPVLSYQFLLQRAPAASDIEDASSTVSPRLLDVVLEFALLGRFDRVGLVLVHGARVTTVAVEK